MNILRWVCLLAVVGTRVEGDEPFRESEIDVIVSLAEHFRASFCVMHRGAGLTSARMDPSKRNLLTSWLTFPEISDFIGRSSDYGGRTLVVVKMNNGTLASLQKLSESTSLSSAIWILFSEQDLESAMFENVYIPFNCEFLYVNGSDTNYSITELYKIERKSSLETFALGYWTKDNGSVLESANFYARRNNLGGCKLKGIIKNHPPYVSIETDEDSSIFGGYLFEIWNELEFRLNFSTEFPKEYFRENPDEVLKKGEVDVAVARIAINPSAIQYMEFSQPIDEAKFYMFGHRPGSELDWDSYLKPFSPNTWFVNLGWMISSSLALAILYKIAWDFGTSEREADYFIFTFSESLLTVFRAICMQGSDVTPRSNSCRLLFLSIYLTALVVTSAFSAALFSLLTIPKPRSPFGSLDEVLNNRRFQIGLPSDPNFHELIGNFSETLPLPKRIKLLGRLFDSKKDFPATSAEGLRRLCHDRTYVFIYDLPNVLHLMQNMTRTCQDKILPSGPPLFAEYIGFGFNKKNPYKRLIDFHLIRMRNEGIINRLLVNYWPPKIPTVQATWVRVTLSDISPIIYMFALGATLGAVLLYGEKILLRFKKKNSIRSHTALLNQQLILSDYSKGRKIPNWELYIRKKDKKLLLKAK